MISVVQSKYVASGFATSVSATLPSGTTSGDLIVVQINWWTNQSNISGLTVTDNQGNTYTRAVAAAGANNAGAEQWYAKNITGGATHTITASWTSNQECQLCPVEISGCDTTAPLDVSAHNANTGSVTNPWPTGTTAADSSASAIAVSGGAFNNTTAGSCTSNNGYTVQQTHTDVINGCLDTKILSSTGTQSDSISFPGTTNDAAALVAVYKAASGAALDPWPALQSHRPQVRTPRQARARILAPPTGQASAPFQPRSRTVARIAPRRPVRDSFPWPQAAANTNQPLFAPQPEPRWRWAYLVIARRQAQPPPPAQAAPPPPALVPLSEPVRRRYAVARRPSAQVPLAAGFAALLPSQPVRRRLAPARRARPDNFPWPQASVVATPPIAYWTLKPRRINAWLRRARPGNFPWPQASAAACSARLEAMGVIRCW